MNDFRTGDRGTAVLTGVDTEGNLISTTHRWKYSIIDDINYYHLVNWTVYRDGNDITESIKEYYKAHGKE